MNESDGTSNRRPDRALFLSVSFLLAVVPLVYSRLVFDSGLTPKLVALTVGALLVALSWLRMEWRGLAPGTGSPIDIPFFLFVVLLLLQWPRAYDVHQASLSVVRMAAIGIIYLAISRCSTEEHRRIWVGLFVVVGFAVSVIGIFQYLGLGFLGLPTAGLPSATFSYRNTAAMFVITVIPFAYLKLVRSKPGFTELFWAVALTTTLVFLVYTRTRGAWAGLLGSVIVVLVMIWLRRFASRSSLKLTLPGRKAGIIAVVLLVTAAASPVTQSERTAAVPQVSSIPEEKVSTAPTIQSFVSTATEIPTGNITIGSGRFGFWKVTASMIRNHPWLGVGLTNWEKEYPKYLEVIWGNMVPRRPHNDYLWVWAELGILGFLAFLSIFCAVALIVARTPERSGGDGLMLCALAGLAAIQGHALFSFPLERAGPLTGMWFCLSLLGAERGSNLRERSTGRVTLAACSTCVVALACLISVRALASEITTSAALIQHGRGEGEIASQLLGPTHDLGVYDYRHLMYHTRIHADEGRFEDAYRVSADVVRRHPNSLNALRNLGETAAAAGKYDDAIATYRKAMRLRPVIHGELRMELARVYARMGLRSYRAGDLDRALSYFQEAVDLRSDMSVAHFGMGTIHLARDDRSRALEAYRAGIKHDPVNADVHYTLGRLYRDAGEDSLAVEHLLAARRVSPDTTLRVQVEALLSEVESTSR